MVFNFSRCKACKFNKGDKGGIFGKTCFHRDKLIDDGVTNMDRCDKFQFDQLKAKPQYASLIRKFS